MSIGLPDEASPLTTLPSPGSSGILVVDEDPAFQLGLKTFLREYVGFEQVFVARSGPEALDLIENEESIDVVTLDYQMPGMNGIEVLEALRDSAPRALSILMITGYPSEELEDEFHSFASPTLLTTHFLSKPVEFERLEPLMLRAHEELLSARRAAAAPPPPDPDADIPEEVPSAMTDTDRIRKVHERLARQEEKLDEIRAEVSALRGKWRGDFWKIVFLVLLGWAAVHYQWIDRLDPNWEQLKGDLRGIFSPAKEEVEEPVPTETSSEDGVPVTEPPSAALDEASASEPAPAPGDALDESISEPAPAKAAPDAEAPSGETDPPREGRPL